MIDTPETTAHTRRGRVWHGGRLVGRLREDGEGHICFTYDRDWLVNGGFALSLSRPLSYGQDEVKGAALVYRPAAGGRFPRAGSHH